MGAQIFDNGPGKRASFNTKAEQSHTLFRKRHCLPPPLPSVTPSRPACEHCWSQYGAMGLPFVTVSDGVPAEATMTVCQVVVDPWAFNLNALLVLVFGLITILMQIVAVPFCKAFKRYVTYLCAAIGKVAMLWLEDPIVGQHPQTTDFETRQVKIGPRPRC